MEAKRAEGGNFFNRFSDDDENDNFILPTTETAVASRQFFFLRQTFLDFLFAFDGEFTHKK